MSTKRHPRRRASFRPTCVLPTAMKPVSAMFFEALAGTNGSETLDLLEVAFVMALDLAQRVAAELFQERSGELERHDRFADNRRCRRGADVGALDRCVGGRLRAHVDGVQRAHQGRDRLHRDARDDRRPVGHTAFGAARVVAAAVKSRRHDARRAFTDHFLRIEENLVVHLRAATTRHLEAQADLDPLHRLDTHERAREPAVELQVPLRVRAETWRHPQRDDFKDAAQRIALFLAVFDQLDHARFGARIGDANRRLFRAGVGLLVGQALGLRLDAAERADIAHNFDAERRQQLFAERADRGARHGVARACAFENVAYVGMVVFENAVQVRVARARLGHGDRFVAVLRRGRHLLGPVLPVAVLDSERNGRAERLAPADAGTDRRLVFFDQHPASAAVALLPAPEIAIDPREVDREARGHAVNDGREARPVRFPRGKITQHGPYITPFAREVPPARLKTAPARGGSRRRLGNVKLLERCGLRAVGLSHAIPPQILGCGQIARAGAGRLLEPAEITRGVMKTMSSLNSFLIVWVLKSHPKSGTSLNQGTPLSVKLLFSRIIPPSTRVSPSRNSTLASASRLSSSGIWAPSDLVPRELDLTFTFKRTKPSLETCGVTVSTMPTGIFSVATAAPAAAPGPLAMLVVPVGSATRTIWRLWMVEATLLSVTTDGRESTRTLPSVSAAVSLMLRSLKRANRDWTIESARPIAFAVVEAANGAPAGLLLSIVAPPRVKPRSAPSARANVGVVSIIFDSINTWGVRVSRRLAISLASSMPRLMSRTRIVLLRSSGRTTPRGLNTGLILSTSSLTLA